MRQPIRIAGPSSITSAFLPRTQRRISQVFDLVAPLVVGFAGSLHCVGMCGPLVLAYSVQLKSPGNPSTIGQP
ncbi:MAG: hypothetical protein GTN81_02970, partial [Proteobacteria bacterium]|nr:hypothetical protein [Pseudomonadota bacterium]